MQSRYYDAQVQRFVSEDEPIFLGESQGVYSYNLYSYCNSDPVNSIDIDGHFAITISITAIVTFIKVVSIIAAVATAATVAYQSYKLTGKIAWVDAVMSGLGMGLCIYSLGMTALEAFEIMAPYYNIADVSSGKITISTGKVIGNTNGLTKDEIRVVNELKTKGCKVEIIPKSSNKTYDFKVNGVKTELKTLNSTNENTAVSKIQEGFKQNFPDRVIVDARKTGITHEQAKRIIERAAGSYADKKLPRVVEIYTKDGIVVGGKK